MFYSQQPLRFQPGSRWQYSTAGIDVLGRIVEVVSGKACADFYTDRIFVPLGMKNTTFWPNARQAAHVAKSYKPGQSSGLEEN
jgi:CubicO group peptidase (beta-lactamase class C family)